MDIKEKSDKIPFMLMEQICINEQLKEELDKKDKEIAKLKQDIRKAMGKDRSCLTFGYYSAYVGLIDDLINIIEED